MLWERVFGVLYAGKWLRGGTRKRDVGGGAAVYTLGIFCLKISAVNVKYIRISVAKRQFVKNACAI